MLLASEHDFGKVLRQQFPVDDSVRACGANDVESVGGELHEDFARKRVVAHAKVGDLGRELVGVVASGETDEEPTQRLGSVLVGGPSHVHNTTQLSTGQFS